ncbi:hypothetical protein ES703_21139 [subsurface metagenome]
MSIDLPSQVINSGKAFFRRPAQPVFKILPDFEISVQIVLVYRFLHHKVHYTGPPPSGETKKVLPDTGLRPETPITKFEILNKPVLSSVERTQRPEIQSLQTLFVAL